MNKGNTASWTKPGSKLYNKLQNGNFKPASELEKLVELKTRVNANAVSNTAPFVADLPKNKAALTESLEKTIRRSRDSDLFGLPEQYTLAVVYSFEAIDIFYQLCHHINFIQSYTLEE